MKEGWEMTKGSRGGTDMTQPPWETTLGILTLMLREGATVTRVGS